MVTQACRYKLRALLLSFKHMIKTTRWFPDTCGCAVDIEWDEAVPSEERTHTGKEILKKCPEHVSFAPDSVAADHAVQLLAENQSKNIMVGVFKTLHPDKECVISFDAARNIKLHAVDLDGEQLAALATEVGKKDLPIQSSVDVLPTDGEVAGGLRVGTD